MKSLFAAAALFVLLAPAAFAQQGYIHGNGDPRVTGRDCGASRFYIDDTTGQMYVAGSGSPCVWTVPGTSGGGLPGWTSTGSGTSQVDTAPGTVAATFSVANGQVVVDGTTRASISAAVTAACAVTPHLPVIIPVNTTIPNFTATWGSASINQPPTLDDQARTCSDGTPVIIEDRRFGELQSNFLYGYSVPDTRMTLRQARAQLTIMDQTAAGHFVHYIGGDSTGGFTVTTLDYKLFGQFGMAGAYAVGGLGAGYFSGGIGSILYPTTGRGGGTGIAYGLNSVSSGDCSAVSGGIGGGTDFTVSPWGAITTFGAASPTANCTYTVNTVNMPALDTIKIWYVKEPGAGTLTVTPLDYNGVAQPAVTANAAAGSVSIGVINMTGLGAVTKYTVSNGTTGRVRVIAGGGENSAAMGVVTMQFAVGGTGIGPTMFNATPLALQQAIFAAFPPIDLATMQWKGNDNLTPTQFATYFQSFYNLVQPYGHGYNASTSPNPVDVAFIGPYPDPVSLTPQTLDNNAAARHVAEANVNAYYFDEGNIWPNGNDAQARIGAFSGVHIDAAGARVLGDLFLKQTGLGDISTQTTRTNSTMSWGTSAAPARNWLGYPNFGWYLDTTAPTQPIATHVGDYTQRGNMQIIGAPLPNPTVIPLATGSTTYSYMIANGSGTSAVVTITNGPATLDATHVIAIVMPPVPELPSQWFVYRTAGGPNQGLLFGSIAGLTQGITFYDNGVSQTGAAPTASLPNNAKFGVNYTPTTAYPVGLQASGTASNGHVALSAGGGNAFNWIECSDLGTTNCITHVVQTGAVGSYMVSPSATGLWAWNGPGGGWMSIGSNGGHLGLVWGNNSKPVGYQSYATIGDSGMLPQYVAAVTTTAAATDTVSNPLIAATSKCFAQPANSTAATAGNTTYFSTYAAGSVVFNHAVTAGLIYDVWCKID